MNLLTEISDHDLGLVSQTNNIKYRVRKASRAIVINQFNQVALLYVSKNNYHKLPGGGFEQNEGKFEALNREVIEEVGVEIKILSDVGVIIEYRNHFEMLQISYCYIASVENILENPSFTDEEIEDGFILKWITLDEAIMLLQDDKPLDYIGKFIQKRDYTFLIKSKQMITEGKLKEGRDIG